MEQNFIFLANVGPKVGFGHVMRCLALAQALSRSGFICSFILPNFHSKIVQILKKNGLKVSFINTNHEPSLDNAEIMSKVIDIVTQYSEKPCMVIDHYEIDHLWEVKIKDYVKKIIVIDDLANRKHQCDLVLDTSFGRKISDYVGLLNVDAKILVGNKYLLLNEKFIKLRENSKRVNAPMCPPSKVLISFGGSDNWRLLKSIIPEIDGSVLKDDTELDIVLGDVVAQTKYSFFRKKLSRFKVSVCKFSDNMPEKILASDLCIGAVGSSTWERLCLGRPSLLTMIADNQVSGALNLSKTGGIQLFDHRVSGDLRDKINSLSFEKMVQMGNIGRMLIDAKGSERVKNYILEEIN